MKILKKISPASLAVGVMVILFHPFLVTSHGAKDYSCGPVSCNTYQQNTPGMETCLIKAFMKGKVVLPNDEDYFKETYGWYNIRYPAAVVYVEDDDEVKTALECAITNGFNVSPRGRGHSFQGLGSMSGYVVIDMKNTCKPEEIVVDTSDTGKHILEGSRYVGTIKAQSGCTNAIMLATGHKYFVDVDGMALIGSCPSVGITGFTLGGGSGDITPYTGYAMDLLKEVEMIIYDGSKVKKVIANEKENSDLFWATRGGGGTNGIITHLTYKVVQAPSNKFTFIKIYYDAYSGSDKKKLKTLLKRVQDFFYKDKNSAKFGGNGRLTSTAQYLNFLYLGSWEDAIRDLNNAGLIDDDMLLDNFPLFMQNYDIKCDGITFCDVNGIPKKGTETAEFDTYAEAMAYKMIADVASVQALTTKTSGNICDDLGIDTELYCIDAPVENFLMDKVLSPTAGFDKDVIRAFLEKAGDPDSYLQEANLFPAIENYIDRTGNNQSVEEIIRTFRSTSYVSYPGGLLFPKLDIDTLFDITMVGFDISHLQHGAPLQISKDGTAFPWRDAAMLTGTYGDPPTSLNQTAISLITQRIVQEDVSKAQGYYAYLNPLIGTSNWKYYYFGEHYPKLSKIKRKFDPIDVFGKPLTVELPYESLSDGTSNVENPCDKDHICPHPFKLMSAKKTRNMFNREKEEKISCHDMVGILSESSDLCILHKEKVVRRCCK